MIEIFGVTYFTHGMATTLFFIISGIFLLIFRKLTKESDLSKKQLLIIAGVCELVIFGILHRDIILAGHQVSKMCSEEGGLHIYKTVEADGLAGLFGIEYWSEYGFSYLETTNSRGEIIRLTINNGEIVKERVDEMISQYIRITKRENVAKHIDDSFIVKATHSVVDRSNDAVLGELIYFTIDQGWADQWLPGEYIPWKYCHKEKRDGQNYNLTVTDLVKGAVMPLNK